MNFESDFIMQKLNIVDPKLFALPLPSKEFGNLLKKKHAFMDTKLSGESLRHCILIKNVKISQTYISITH